MWLCRKYNFGEMTSSDGDWSTDYIHALGDTKETCIVRK